VTGPGTGAPDVRAAYRHCEQVTRQQARNFSYGISLLPGDKRRALSAVYAFARRIDDIGDGTLPPAAKLAELDRARAGLAELAGGDGGADPVGVALADAARRFPIPLGAFGELIDGCEADVRGASYATFAELEGYCRCVAGSIGRLSLGVFGSSDLPAAQPLADALGIALQLVNILRDVREDLASGRVYLPAEDLQRYGCTLTPGAAGLAELGSDRALAALIRFEGERARQWYATGARLLPMLDRRSAAAVGAMAGIYWRLLGRICAAPQEALQRRMSLPAREKAAVAAQALAGAASGGRWVAGPLPRAAGPVPGPSGPVPGPSGPVPGPSGPVPGPAGPVPGGTLRTATGPAGPPPPAPRPVAAQSAAAAPPLPPGAEA
jgi:15-cis-phytoene synthase